jgi:hypothetical protein
MFVPVKQIQGRDPEGQALRLFSSSYDLYVCLNFHNDFTCFLMEMAEEPILMILMTSRVIQRGS